jgi:hypothetical protein
MIVLLIPLAVIVLALIGPPAVRAYCRYRMTAELRRDWWPQFENELRQYMCHTWRSAREAERNV